MESYPETVLFVGAGATQSLAMPPTSEQAKFLWYICDTDTLSAEKIEEAAACFKGRGRDVCLMVFVLDGDTDGNGLINLDDARWQRAFPCVSREDLARLIPRLRRRYDWGALKLIAKAKKGGCVGASVRDDYLQEVFTMMDVCMRDGRGLEVFDGKEMVFLSVERVRAAHEALVLLINTMFACAWQWLLRDAREKLKRYRQFFHSLAVLMQDEARRLGQREDAIDKRRFYQFSYSLVTTNFEPVFLWLIWNAHDKVNHGLETRIGNPGRLLKLLMNFPNSVGMRKPADKEGDPLSPDIWFPCTEAVAQNVNNPKYSDNRIFRLGMYYPVHGMSTTRHCPKCGRLNLYLGDTWNENSETLFPNGIINPFNWGQKPRTSKERAAHGRGEYDALECHFCGELTYAYDNFMFMQTQLKRLPPSFIKETTDDALAVISKARHVVLLGYSMPLDDAIWGSLLTMASRRKNGEAVFCSVVATYDPGGPDEWLYGKKLDDYLTEKGKLTADREKVRAIKNAVSVFGKENVRAYVRGIPDVFGEGTVDNVRNLLYPHKQSGWNIPEFTCHGVSRT